ncbi:MAG TPA: UDP-N-acetylmuramoyl-L-alanine--D-glutamate ligase [Chloroflexota bacterium]|nr:UDP-N-acetylmuramoyl-L-alanine--D-glutamate ligase [Chloroflexota bacterium]
MEPRRGPIDYTGMRALVMGLGVHGGGAGVARFLAQRGARVTVTDLQPAEQLQESMSRLEGLDVRYVLGEHHDEDFLNADFIVRNPAVPVTQRHLALARQHGVPIYMEMTLFFMECPPDRVVGVTGTRGKTTTTTLIGEILKADRRDVVVAGNLRVSALEQLARIGSTTDVVLEMSSFQLEGLEVIEKSPRAAVLTNLLTDHLNRYPSLEAYFEAKRNIFRYQGSDGILALNRDDPRLAAWEGLAPGFLVWYSPSDDVPGAQRARLKGAHNRANMAAAAAITAALGVEQEVIGRAIQGFAGVPYRQELIREIDGVQFVNDTAATSPDATIAALAVAERPTVLIAGGADKGLDFDALGEAVRAPGSLVKAVVLLEGSATERIAALIGDRLVGRFDDLRTAIAAAWERAAPGDTVLLSPGCASFGMFRNEFDRGDQFNAIVRSF